MAQTYFQNENKVKFLGKKETSGISEVTFLSGLLAKTQNLRFSRSRDTNGNFTTHKGNFWPKTFIFHRQVAQIQTNKTAATRAKTI